MSNTSRCAIHGPVICSRDVLTGGLYIAKVARANERGSHAFVNEVKALDAAIKDTMMKTKAAIDKYEGGEQDKKELTESIAQSELKSRMEELSGYVCNALSATASHVELCEAL